MFLRSETRATQYIQKIHFQMREIGLPKESQLLQKILLLLTSYSESNFCDCKFERAFHGFGQAKFPCVGLVLGSSQSPLQPQLP